MHRLPTAMAPSRLPSALNSLRAIKLGCALLFALLFLVFAASSGRAAEASWSFNPSSWDFGTRLPGSGPSPPKAFSLENTGDVELSLFFVGIGGNEGAGFAIAENTCGELAPGESCAFLVTFNPASAGPKSGQLSVSSQDGVAPFATAQLSGTGAGPIVAIAPSSHVFDPRTVGAGPSASKEFRITNEGILDLAISSVSVGHRFLTNADQFQLMGGTCTAGATVPPGRSCTIEVAFSPTFAGLLAADLQIASNAPGLPYFGTVEGLGVAPPRLVPDPVSRVAPWVSILHRPRKTTRKRFAAFWLNGSPSASQFLCKLDNRSFSSCESPAYYNHLARGAHRFAVRAIDDSGRSSLTTQFRWRVRAPRK